MRNSPRSLAVASRVREDPADRTTTRAPAMRAALASCTSPRSVPFGLCAHTSKGRKTKIRSEIGRMTTPINELTLRLSRNRNLATIKNPPANQGFAATQIGYGKRPARQTRLAHLAKWNEQAYYQ